MLNRAIRAEAFKKLEASVKRHEEIRNQVQGACMRLHDQRERVATVVIKEVARYVSSLANSPREFDDSVARFRLEASRFGEIVQEIENSSAKDVNKGSATGLAGAMAGVGVAAFGPSAAMAIATTFGTASTGTAISALSGGVATKAALAWLGGGALAAGGGGVAGGKALLALAGPVGWGIGIATLGGAGLFLRHRNAKYAEEANESRMQVDAEVYSLSVSNREIEGLIERTSEHESGCSAELGWFHDNEKTDYAKFEESDKERLAALINHIRSLGELIRTEVVL